MGKKLKKKQQQKADNSQLVKIIGLCVVIAGGVYLLNQMGGGASSGNTVVNLGGDQPAQPGSTPVQPPVIPNNPSPETPSNPDTETPEDSDHSGSTPKPGSEPMTPGSEENPGVDPTPKTPGEPMEPGQKSAHSTLLSEWNAIEIPEYELSYEELVEQVQPAVVKLKLDVRGNERTATGYVISQKGLVITTAHALAGTAKAIAEFSDGSELKVQGVRLVDSQFNIAVLQLEVGDIELAILPLLNSRPEQGTDVVSFGAAPFRAMHGKITAFRFPGEIKEDWRFPLQGTWLHVSSSLPEEISGGPVVNQFGQVVGINTVQLSLGKNTNFSLSASDLIQIANTAYGKETIPMKPHYFKPLPAEIGRKAARDIEGTERGQILLTKIREMDFKLVMQKEHPPVPNPRNPRSPRKPRNPRKQANPFEPNPFEPTPPTNPEPQDEPNPQEFPPGQHPAPGFEGNHARLFGEKEFHAHVEQLLKKNSIKPVSEASLSPENAPVLVLTQRKKLFKKSTNLSYMISVEAELIGIDPDSTSANKYVKLWSVEETELGLVSPLQLAQSRLPPRMSPKLTSFLTKFRTARSKAKRALKEGKE